MEVLIIDSTSSELSNSSVDSHGCTCIFLDVEKEERNCTNWSPCPAWEFCPTSSYLWTSELTVLPKQTAQDIISFRSNDLTVPTIFSLVESLNSSRRIIPQNTRCWFGFSFSTASPLFPLALLCMVLPQILPSHPTPLSCQQLPTFLLAQHLTCPHLTISDTHPQSVISSPLFHIKP